MSLIFQTLQEALYPGFVAFFSGANKIVISNVEVFPDWLPGALNQAITPLLRRDLILRCGVHDLFAMFVGAREKPNILAACPVPASKYIARNCCVGMTNMRGVIYIVNRCGEIELAGGRHGHILPSLRLLVTIASNTSRFATPISRATSAIASLREMPALSFAKTSAIKSLSE